MRHRIGSLALARRALPLGLLTASVLAACGPTPSVSVQVADAVLELILGGWASTEVSITRAGGATADVVLDADGAPDWVTVSLSPATLSGSTLTSTMTIETDADDPDAEPTSFALTVTGTGTGLDASDELTVEVTLLTVTGRLTGVNGEPQTGMSISVNGATPVPVDSLGNFSVPDVTIPYDLLVLDVPGSFGHLYDGLTTTDLVLQEPPGGPTYGATLSGDLSEAVGAGQIAVVCMEGGDRPVTGCTSVGPGNTDYAIVAGWLGSDTVSAHVHAWVIDVDADGMTTGFDSEGRTAVDLTDAVAAPGVDVTLGDGPASTTVDVTVTSPPGVPYTGSVPVFSYGEFASAPLPGNSTAASYTAVMPDVPGSTYTVVGQASTGEVQAIGWEVGDPDSAALDVVMGPVVTVVGPAEGATGVNLDTQFSVNNPTGSAVTFLISGPVIYFVTTGEGTTNIPDLGSFGLPLPTGANYGWQVLTTPHLQTVDDLVREGWLSPLAGLQLATTGGPGPAFGGQLSVTGTRTFTTE